MLFSKANESNDADEDNQVCVEGVFLDRKKGEEVAVVKIPVLGPHAHRCRTQEQECSGEAEGKTLPAAHHETDP